MKNKILIFSLFVFFFCLSSSKIIACTATTSCNACGKNYVASDSVDCKGSFPNCVVCDDGRGHCVDPGCDAECDRDADGCPTGSVTASCNECGGGGDDALPTPTACPNPPPPVLSSPASGSTFILPSAPAQLFVDQVIRGISQSCGPNAPEYNIIFGFMGATWEKGWNSSLTWHTGPYGRTGTVSWKAKSRYLDSAYSTYRESIWTNPWTYQIVSPTPIPTATPAKTCDAAVTNWDPCYNSTRTAGSCQDANIRLRGQIINYGNSTSNISYRVTDYNGTVIYGGESRSLVHNQVWDINHTELPPDASGNYPDFGVIYCGGLKLNVFCTDKPDANPNNNEGKKASPIRACQIIPPTPTPTQIPVSGWFQTQEGDVHAGGKIVSAIPTMAPNRNFSLFGLTGSPGIISYNGTQEPNFGEGFASNNDVAHWVARTAAQRRNFDYFYNLLGSPAVNFSGSSLPRDTGIYYATGNSTISSVDGGFVGSLKRIVILVRGNLDVSTNIDIPESLASSLVVVTSGDINIFGVVTKLAGVFLADGVIDTGEANTQLRVEGALISNNLTLKRDLGLGNRTKPAELFVNRPDFFINSHPLLWKSSFASWQELVP